MAGAPGSRVLIPRIGAKRILVVRLGAIGDVVNASCLLAPLRELYPSAHIAWAVHEAAASLLEGHPLLDQVVVLPRSWIPRQWRLIRQALAGVEADLALDLQKLAKSALVAWLSGARIRVGYDRTRAKELSWLVNTHLLPAGDRHSHVVDQVLEFATYLGAPRAAPRWNLAITETDRTFARGLGLPGTRPHVVVSLGSTEESKRWTPPGFARLLDQLSQRGAVAVLSGGPSPAEQHLAAQVRGLARSPFVDATRSTRLRDLLGLFEGAGAFVGGDTGPLHLAAALGVPTVGIYGAQNWNRSGPYGQIDHVVHAGLPCAPCFAGRCPQGTTACMRLVRAEDVMTSLESLCRVRRVAIFENPC